MFNFKKMLIVLSTSFVFFAPLSKPVQSQNVVSAEDLDQLSLDELYIYRDETMRQANIVINNCIISCDIIQGQYDIFFLNLDNYIAQREVLGQ